MSAPRDSRTRKNPPDPSIGVLRLIGGRNCDACARSGVPFVIAVLGARHHRSGQTCTVPVAGRSSRRETATSTGLFGFAADANRSANH